MEEYNLQLSENANSREGGGGGSFLYSGGGSFLVPGSSMYASSSSHHGGFPGDCYDEQGDGGRSHHAAVVKTEAGTSLSHALSLHYPSIIRSHESLEDIKAKIVAHPQYSNLLEAYMGCQKVGAPPEVVARLTALQEEFASTPRAPGDEYSKDPELDQFMEAYYVMLMKYREELSRPLKEAMDFMRRVQSQLNLQVLHSEEKRECIGSSEEDEDNSGGEPEIDPLAEDRQLKNHLLKKYSGCLSSLKQELSKKKKRGKLPKEARRKLLNWWDLHYKWPYPSESEKAALAESTGLDQKQINNWFINQRKRHWKPSEEMQFMVMDGLHPPNAALYTEGRRHYMSNDDPYRLGP